MTSTLNDDSLIKMDRVGKEQVIEMFKRGFTYQQVSDELKKRCPGKRRFSVPSIKRFGSKNGISSRISNHFVLSLVSAAVKGVGYMYNFFLKHLIVLCIIKYYTFNHFALFVGWSVIRK